MKNLKPTCREVHQIVSERMDHVPTLVKRVRMHAHLIVCAKCSRFDAQMRFLRRAMRELK